MTTLLDKAFARARTLPEDEQNAVAGAVMDYLDTGPQLRLSDEHVVEVAEVFRESHDVIPQLNSPAHCWSGFAIYIPYFRARRAAVEAPSRR